MTPEGDAIKQYVLQIFKMQKIYLPGRPKIPEITDLAQDSAIVQMLSYFEIVWKLGFR